MEAGSKTLPQVAPVDEQARARMQERLDSLVKPQRSLGRLEQLACQLAAIQGTEVIEVDPALAFVFAGDHGVVEEGVAPYPQTITRRILHVYHRGGGAVNVLARQAAVDVEVVDVGVKGTEELPASVVARSVAPGTRNFLVGPAMSLDETWRAIEVGMERARRAIARGYRTILLGEVGIGNTTVAAALAAALLGESAAVMTGPGSGAQGETLRRKVAVVETALARHAADGASPLELLARLGGFEVAALVGAILESASRRTPVVLDGYITGTAALVAVALVPEVAQYLIASHVSREGGHRRVLAALSLVPLLDWELCLGEASGAVLVLPLLRQAVAVARQMATFAESGLLSDTTETPANAEPTRSERYVFTYPERRAVYQVLYARRDIRSFRPDPVPAPVLARVLRAMHAAPSVGFSQPWDVLLVREEAQRRALRELAERERLVQAQAFPEERRRHFLRLKVEGLLEAPWVLLVTANTLRKGPEVLGRHTQPETTHDSTVLAIENLWLAARAEGLGVGWVSFFHKEDLRRLFRLPEGVEPVAVLTLGYPVEFPAEPILKREGWEEEIPWTEVLHGHCWDEPPPRELLAELTLDGESGGGHR